MVEFGLRTWHDFATLGLLIGYIAFACAFLVWERRSRRRRDRRRWGLRQVDAVEPSRPPHGG